MPFSAAKILTFASTGEATWGTTGNPTKKLHGITDASLKAERTVEVVQSVGWFGPSPTAQVQKEHASASAEFVAVYEDITNIINGLMTYTSASTGNSTGGTTAPYYYSWTAPVTSTQVVARYPIEFGTSGASYKLRGGIINGLTLKGEAGGYWTGSVDLLGKYVETSTYTTAANVDRTVNPIRMADTSLYVDAFSTATIGVTQTSGNLISFELAVNPNRHVKYFAGSQNPQDWGDGKWEGSLKLVFEYNSSAKSLIDESLGTTGVAVSRQISVKALQGSSGTQKSFDIQFAGIRAEGETFFGDRDGNMIIETMWQGRYSTGLGNWLKFIAENGSSSTT